MGLLNLRAALDTWVRKDIVFVRAGRGKFAEDGTLITRLQPVQAVGRQSILVARPKDDFTPGCEIFFMAFGKDGFRLGCRIALDIKIDFAPPAAERLLFSDIFFAHFRMPVFRADLAGQEDQFLGAIAVIVFIDDDLEAEVLEVIQPEVRHFHIFFFFLGDYDFGFLEKPTGFFPGSLDFF